MDVINSLSRLLSTECGAYREQINQIKKKVDASLQADNTVFCGFLMMAMENFAETKIRGIIE
ncbi:hypothetical protein ACHOLT_04795 [Desulfitobacterium sp. Sab5]|uniref:hypothetical protein n=1 Tax=Desulfitobacterium nosdiversum TaxID=3375356 RepID=UPI003CF5B269